MRRVAARRAKAKAKQEEELFFENAITWAEDGHTAIAKLNTDNPQRQAIDRGHANANTNKPSILQTSKNWGYALQSTVKGWARNVSQDQTHVTVECRQVSPPPTHCVPPLFGLRLAGVCVPPSKEGVSVHKEEDVLITVKNEPILIGVRDEQGRYRIPLQQHKGQWKPRHASKKARQTLRKFSSL
eukprot:scaffold69668_cov62-Cyclotella_meneghiniana.AAC.4